MRARRKRYGSKDNTTILHECIQGKGVKTKYGKTYEKNGRPLARMNARNL